MSDRITSDEAVRLAAEQAGLGKALKQFPNGVKAAVERGTRPLGAPPKGTPPLIHPAPVFDPSRFEPDR